MAIWIAIAALSFAVLALARRQRKAEKHMGRIDDTLAILDAATTANAVATTANGALLAKLRAELVNVATPAQLDRLDAIAASQTAIAASLTAMARDPNDPVPVPAPTPVPVP